MESVFCEKGQIFVLEDKCVIGNRSVHNYLILGANNNKDRLSFIQCMGITSMQDKQINMEVPIKLCNGMISYVVPYNIHSYLDTDIDIRGYKGCLHDSEIISKDDFIKLLLDIYNDSLGISYVPHEDIVDRYNKYISKFWNKYSDTREYREYKEKRDYTINNEVNDNKESIKQPVVTPRKRSERFNPDFYKNKYNSSVNVNKMLPSTNNNEVKDKPEITLEGMKKFLNLSKFVKDWEDDDIIYFIKGYNKFEVTDIMSILSLRWKARSSLVSWLYACKLEANKRDLNVGLAMKLTEPIVKWSDKDLLKIKDVLKNNIDNKNYLIEVMGFNTEDDVDKLMQRVTKEIKKREKVS